MVQQFVNEMAYVQHTGAARALVERKLSDGLAITVRQRAAARRPQTTESDSASSVASIDGDAQRVVIDSSSLERIAQAVVWSSLAERSYFQIETSLSFFSGTLDWYFGSLHRL